jgi:hypothetical protein
VASYRSTLELGHGAKGIPYGGFGEVRPDGGANHGFKDLKSNLEAIGTVPELVDDPALMTLMFAINQPMTGLFSVGCASGDIEEAGRHRRGGYVEVAFNSKTMVLDAGSYFPLFFHFGRMLHENQFADRVGFFWVLEPVSFIRAGIGGFTACVWVNTDVFESKAEAGACWERALSALTRYLGSIPIQDGEPLCPVDI